MMKNIIVALLFMLAASTQAQTTLVTFEYGTPLDTTNTNYPYVKTSYNVALSNTTLCSNITPSTWCVFDHNTDYLILKPLPYATTITFDGYCSKKQVATNFEVDTCYTINANFLSNANTTNQTLALFSVDSTCPVSYTFSCPPNKYIKFRRASSPDQVFIDNIAFTGSLPVELSLFHANVINNQIQLMWRTETEANNYGFDVQVSHDQNTWETLGFREGYGTSNIPHEYKFIHNEYQKVGHTNFYRLKQVDRDGSVEYSHVLSVQYNPSDVMQLDVAPNPSKGFATISFDVQEEGNVTIDLFDISGKMIKNVYHQYSAKGFHSVSLNPEGLHTGTYYILYSLNSTKIFVKKIVAGY